MTTALRSLVALLIAALVATPARPGRAAPPRPATVTGRVVDPAGTPVAGAEVYFYAGANTKRPADFISPPTGRDGRYTAALSAGRYWAVARVRRGGPGTGPLAPGDRHSGAPETIDVRAGSRRGRDFVVADLREMVRRSRKTRADYHVVRGRILARGGVPLADRYVVARRRRAAPGLPEFISGWTGPDGRYALHLPAGRYFVAAAAGFPPALPAAALRPAVVHAGLRELDILTDEAAPAPRPPKEQE